ncbi:MAG: cadherin domain-containing protein, partial [Blastopirellula sp. JB062]
TDVAGNQQTQTISIVSNKTPQIESSSLDGETIGETLVADANHSITLGSAIELQTDTNDPNESLSYSVSALTLVTINGDVAVEASDMISVTVSPTGVVTIKDPLAKLDYDQGVRGLKFTTTVSDVFQGQGSGAPQLTSDPVTFSIDLDPINETPVIADGDYVITIREDDTDAFTPVNPLDGFVTDPEVDDPNQAQSLTYELSGDNAALFTIDENTGAIGIANGASFDFETTQSYQLIVTVSDGDLEAMTSVTVNVDDVNEDPVFDGPFVINIAENLSSGVVGAVSATDPDAADDDPTPTNPENAALTYSFDGVNDSRFSIDSSTGDISIVNGSVFDFETEPQITLNVLVEDAGNPTGSHTATVTVNITDVNETPEIDDPSYTGEIEENSSGGTQVTLNSALSATDPDDADGNDLETLTFSFAPDGQGGFHNGDGLFQISDDGVITLINNDTLNHEDVDSYTLKVVVSDGVNTSAAVDVVVSVLDVNEAPEIDLEYSISETALVVNVGSPETVLTVNYEDEDEGDSVTFTDLNTGTASGIFELQSNGLITFVGATIPAPGSYTINFESVDMGGNEVDDTITIQVLDNLPPENVTVGSLSILENSPASTSAGTIAFADPDVDQADFVASAEIIGISVGAVGDFELVSLGDGQYDVRVLNSSALNHEANPTITITVEVKDNNDIAASYDFDIAVGDVNDAPDVVDPQLNPNVDEFVATISPSGGSPANGDVVLDLSDYYDDQDGDQLTFSIEENDLFEIDGSGKNVVIKNAALLNVDGPSGFSSFDINVSANDGTAAPVEQTISIAINAQNELPLPLDQSGVPLQANGSDIVELGNINIAFADMAGLTDGDPLPNGIDILSILNLGPDGIDSDPEGDGLIFVEANGHASEFAIDAAGNITVPDTTFLDSLGDVTEFTLSFNYNDGTLSTTDLGANSIQFTITIVKNAVPVIGDVPAADFSIDENSTPNSPTVPALTFNVTDPDVGDTIDSVTVSAPGIADGIFKAEHVSGSQYQIVVDSSANLDYEAIFNAFDSDTITLTITATDNRGGVGTREIDVTVNDVNEAPTIDMASYVFSVDEIAPGSSTGTDTLVGTVSTTDPDAADDAHASAESDVAFAQISYELTGDGAENFYVESDGSIRVADGAVLDFEDTANNQFNLTLVARDRNGAGLVSTNTASVTINLLDANDAPETTDVMSTTIIIDDS